MPPHDLKQKIFALVKEYYDITFHNKPSPSIPVSGKFFDAQELIQAVDAVLDGWWTEGRFAVEFEKKFNQFLHTKHTLVVNSGSSANLIAFHTLLSPKLGDRKIKRGDEVITVAAGFPTTVNPIINCGCIPTFCDVELETYNIDVQCLEEAISQKTKAIFLAHTLGNPFNLKKVKEICSSYNLWLIEDACDGLGSLYDNKYVGTFGNMGTFSFYPAHQITMGEGGAIITADDQLAKVIRSIRDWGRDCWCPTGRDNTCKKRFSWQLGNLPYGYDHKYIYSEIGYNLKNTDLNIAIGLAQLEKLPRFIQKRQENFTYLFENFKKFKDLLYLPKASDDSKPCWFGFPITLKPDLPFTRLNLLEYLTENGIGTRLLFGGNITRQPYFIDYKIKYRVVGELKNTDYIMNHSFWIGVNPLLSQQDLKFIVEKFDAFFDNYS